MHSEAVTLKPGADPHVFSGEVRFTMGGPWTLHITYDGKALDIPLTIGSS